jgi:hypothetical protein
LPPSTGVQFWHCFPNDHLIWLLHDSRLRPPRRPTSLWKLPQLRCAFQYWPWRPAIGTSPKVQSSPLTSVLSRLASYLDFLAKFGVEGKGGGDEL